MRITAMPTPGTRSRRNREDFYEDLGTTYVRMDRKLRDHLYRIYAGAGENDLKTVSDIVWFLTNRDIDISVVEHYRPEVTEWLLNAAADRNAAYAKRVMRETRRRGGKIARVELE
jgi:hypothetical protein